MTTLPGITFSYTRIDMSRIEHAFTGDGGDTIVDPNDGNRAVEE